MPELREYLREHLRRAEMASEHLQHLVDRHRGDIRAAFFESLLAEVQSDREMLSTIIRRVVASSRDEYATDRARGAPAGWRGPERDPAPLDLRDMEQVALDLFRTLMLWRALAIVAEHDARLHAINFERLADRAFNQYERVERRRLELTALLGREAVT
jgi:hypothetical protein